MPYIIWKDNKNKRFVVAYHDGGSRTGSTFQERYDNDRKEFYRSHEEYLKEYEECLDRCMKLNYELDNGSLKWWED
jgi:hypothetical protein